MHQLIALGGKIIIREDLPNGGTREAEICPVTRCVLWWRVNGPNEEETPVGAAKREDFGTINQFFLI
jgi:hypothetical protein